MKRQVHEDKESVISNIEENVRIEQDFFDDWAFIIYLSKFVVAFI
jgi:hypothetical protein